jgi:predicted RNA methylase
MNKANELLIKYKFTDKIIENNNLENEILKLNKNIENRVLEFKKQRNEIMDKEVFTLNNILSITDDDIIYRINTNIEDLIEDEYITAKSIDKIYELKIKLENEIDVQFKKEEQWIESIKQELGNAEFDEMKQYFISNEFLEYLNENQIE